MKKIRVNLFIFLLAAELISSTFVKVNLDQIVQRSNFIFKGQILSKNCYFDTSSKKIFTQYFIKIEKDYIQNLKDRSEIFSITLEGGALNDTALIVDGMPQFFVGDRVLFFIENEHFIFPFPGGPQGVFKIKKQGNDEIILDWNEKPVKFAGATGDIFVSEFDLDTLSKKLPSELNSLTKIDEFEQMIVNRIRIFNK